MLHPVVQHAVHQAFIKAYPHSVFSLQDIEVTQTKDSQHGDYQCNSAMRLTKRLESSPRAIAEAIIAQLVTSEIFDKLEIAGPGFINMTLSTSLLIQHAKSMLLKPTLGIARISKAHPQKLIIDFSSPNVAKEMHVGHLRSTIIGDSLARVFEYLGYDVLRLNHIGDWGTAFGMLICHMQSVSPRVLTGEQPASLQDLMHWYRDSKKQFDIDPEFMKASQQKVVALQAGDPSALKAWKIICEISEKAYQEIYGLLDVKILSRGESFYNPYLKQTLEDLKNKNLITESEGAQCIFLEGFTGKEGEPLPLMIQKSDGGYGYASTDMASIWHRTQIEKADRLIYVTDMGQGLHFAMIFAAAKKAGYLPDNLPATHVPFGLVLGPDGKKFKTRSGDTEKLIDLLYTAIDHAKQILITRDTPAPEIDQMAHVLGINAVKYADLASNRLHDYVFSYERMLKFEGNTAAFIMYSLVRILSIQRKVGLAHPIDPKALTLTHHSERPLILHVLRFSECLESVIQDLYPHRLTDYLYQLAHYFNGFFRDCRIEGDPHQASRLTLAALTGEVFKTGMHLLGLQYLERM